MSLLIAFALVISTGICFQAARLDGSSKAAAVKSRSQSSDGGKAAASSSMSKPSTSGSKTRPSPVPQASSSKASTPKKTPAKDKARGKHDDSVIGMSLTLIFV